MHNGVGVGIAFLIAAGAGWWLYEFGTDVPGDTITEQGTGPILDNREWSQYAYNNAVTSQRYFPDEVERSMSKFHSGQRLNGEEVSIVRSIFSFSGPPPHMPKEVEARPYMGIQSSTTHQPVNGPYAGEGYST